VAHTCNLSNAEAELRRSQIRGQAEIHSETLSKKKKSELCYALQLVKGEIKLKSVWPKPALLAVAVICIFLLIIFHVKVKILAGDIALLIKCLPSLHWSPVLQNK
jgi:hypothetical protein